MFVERFRISQILLPCTDLNSHCGSDYPFQSIVRLAIVGSRMWENSYVADVTGKAKKET
jgi:hypothetical protein